MSIRPVIQKISRKSPGIFGLFNKVTSKPLVTILFLTEPLVIGLCSTLFQYFFSAPGLFNIDLMIRDFIIFYVIIGTGSLGDYLFHKKAPILNFRISMLINIYGSFFFALSYFLGIFLEIFFRNPAFIDIFFILGGLFSFITMFVIFFSFTTVETPLNILLALIQPVAGILFYSYFTSSISINFFIKAILFFCTAALVFAIPYSANMFSVSRIYRTRTGIGGYNFIRAFVTSLLVENQDDLVEKYFDEIGVDCSIEIQYLAFRKHKDENSKITKDTNKDANKDENKDANKDENKDTNKDAKCQRIHQKEKPYSDIKGLFVIPNVHFGPFKTAGSSSLPESIHKRFQEIPGLTVFHTTTTHGENLTSHRYNASIVQIIEEDLSKIEFKDVKIPEFKRFLSGKAKILGTIVDDLPFMILTRHPFPSDDMMPEVGNEIKNLSHNTGYSKDPHIIDAHNAIIGDEILIKADSNENSEIQDVSRMFLENMKVIIKDQKIYPVEYGTAHDSLSEYPVEWGIGSGGVTVHVFRINRQLTALIHFDANNALMNVRSSIINLGENKGIDRIEVSTSDSHTTARILSAQGYYPLGEKITINMLLPKLENLLDDAIKNLELVDIAIYKSNTPGFRKWGDIGYFDVVLETIEKCLGKSKQLLTINLVIPALFSLLIAAFYFNIPLPT